jgi:hypothetical protein
MQKFVGCLARDFEVLVGKYPVANIEQQQTNCLKAARNFIFCACIGFCIGSSVDPVYDRYLRCKIGKISSDKDGEYFQDKFVSRT